MKVALEIWKPEMLRYWISHFLRFSKTQILSTLNWTHWIYIFLWISTFLITALNFQDLLLEIIWICARTSKCSKLFLLAIPFRISNQGEKNADTVPRTSNYHFVKLLATAIATFLQETVNADPKKLLMCIPKNCQCGSQWIINADPNEQLMRIPMNN